MEFMGYVVLHGKKHFLSNSCIKFVAGTSCTLDRLKGFDPVKTYQSKELAY